MPVIAGPEPALSGAIIDRRAFSLGVTAVLVMPPFYFKRPTDAGVIAWFQRLIDAAVPTGGRMLLYHIPQTTGVPITDGILTALHVSHGEALYGIKDSTGDPAQGNHIRATFSWLTYFVGNDHLIGAACAMRRRLDAACANVFPDLASCAANGLGRRRCRGSPGHPVRRALLESFRCGRRPRLPWLRSPVCRRPPSGPRWSYRRSSAVDLSPLCVRTCRSGGKPPRRVIAPAC
jgi:hypothetical protein